MSAHTTRRLFLLSAGALLVAGATACGDDYGSEPNPPAFPPSTAILATGDLTAKLAEMRATLGEPSNGNAAGQQPAGRREINWDGVGAANTNTNTFPSAGFSNRGLLMSTPGTGLRISDNDFSDVNQSYDAAFEDFSPAKTIMSVGSNVMELAFRVPGDTTQVATVRAFGVVFSDVDVANSTAVEFYDATGRLIGRAVAPVRSDAKGHSLVAVSFNSPLIAKVRIFSGQGALGAAANDVTQGGTVDVVVMDDFFYSEPVKS